MKSKKINIRLADNHQEMLDKIIAKKQIMSNKIENKVNISSIIKEAILYTYKNINIINDNLIKENIIDIEFKKNNAVLFEKCKNYFELLEKISIDSEIILEKITEKKDKSEIKKSENTEYFNNDFF